VIKTVSKLYQNHIKTLSKRDQNHPTLAGSIDDFTHDLPANSRMIPINTPGFDRQKKNFTRHAATHFAQLASPQHFPKTHFQF
jgi:hypothetical protein